eukprot:g76174.t1
MDASNVQAMVEMFGSVQIIAIIPLGKIPCPPCEKGQNEFDAGETGIFASILFPFPSTGSGVGRPWSQFYWICKSEKFLSGKHTAHMAKTKRPEKVERWFRLPGLRAEYREDDGVLMIHGIQPDSVDIRSGKYGRGMYANKDFKKGEVLYIGSYLMVPNDTAQKVEVVTPRQKYEGMTLGVHSVLRVRTDTREVYGFDAFMNHSCDPCTYSVNIYDSDEFGSYETVATRDIKAGDEITCDYDLFEWDAKDKGIDPCSCGAEQCRGRAIGFYFLPPETQEKLLPYAMPEIARTYEKHMAEDGEGDKPTKKKGKAPAKKAQPKQKKLKTK